MYQNKKFLVVLGTQASNVQSLDKRYLVHERKFMKRAEKMCPSLELKGEGSIFPQLQPFSHPDINELIGRSIEFLSSIDFDIKQKTSELRWCQGKVLSIVESTSELLVEVERDPIPDALGYKNTTVNNKTLLPSKWRKAYKGAWRMDVEIDIESDIVTLMMKVIKNQMLWMMKLKVKLSDCSIGQN
jgi:hypothetical protein